MAVASLIAQSKRITRFLLAGMLIAVSNYAAPVLGDRPNEDVLESASESPAGKNRSQSKDQNWFEALATAMKGDHTSPQARDHGTVLDAFRETVDFPASCMVRILCNNEQVALGTVVDPDGLVVTKGSELGEQIACELDNGVRHPAELVGNDRESDLALLKVPAGGLPAIDWSDEEPPSVGGWVVTPGLDEVPQAIGVVSVAPHRVRGGVLGIQLTEDNPGPRITHVVPSSGAAEAGLMRGDIIAEINSTVMERADEVVEKTSSMLPGEELHLSLLRHGEEKRVTATLGSVSDTLASRRARFQDRLGSPLSTRRFLFPSAMEHDSVLAPNQCGGVLVNLDGKAIGVNIARASRISSYAIPADVARPIIDSLVARFSSQSATLPVATEPIDAAVREKKREH